MNDFVTAPENPFSASRLRPGAMSFLFAPGDGIEPLLAQLRDTAWRGEIIGPHGSGKSSFLAALLGAIENSGRRTLLATLHDAQRRLPSPFKTAIERQQPAVLAVDGVEQLWPWNRLLLRRLAVRRGLGLIVTSHRSVGLPLLFRTVIDLATAWQVTERLQEGYPQRITMADVAARLPRHGANLRELLFDLYDVYEQRRR